MRTLIFATNNQHKVDEIRAVIGDKFNIVTLKEAGIDIDIPEPHDTLQANAIEKATVIHQLTKQNVFSEDTGLEVDALYGEPGVKSARYAGDDKNFQANIDKLLDKLGSGNNRSARFRTVICLILDDQQYLFEGICEGEIIAEQKGTKGFGYDPVFIPYGSDKTFAEMDMDEKNMYSHRRKATDKLIAFLQLSNYHIFKFHIVDRIKLSLPENFSFSTKIKIRITDLNYGGHVGNDVFLSLVQEARQQFLNHHGYGELQFEGVGLIMTDAVVEFKKELNYGDEVNISVAATGFDRLGFDLYYKLEVNNELAGKAKTGMLCYDYSAKKVVAVPGAAKQKLLNA